MSRKLRLKCPACQTLIETSVDDEQRVTLQCAACHQQFTAKVPPRAAEPVQGASPSHPVVAARPVSARPISARPVSARPVSAQPVPAQPVTSRPITAQAAQYHAPSPSPQADPLFDASNDFSFPVAPMAYQPVRKRKPLNLRPFFTIGGSVIGGVLVICLGLYVWQWAANTDWSTFSLVPDSHERLTAEWIDRCDRTAIENINLQSSASVDYERVKALLLEAGRQAETTLVRAVRLGKVPLEKKAAYQAKQDALDKKVRELMDAKLAELRASNAKPPIDPARMAELAELPAVRDGGIMSMALANYLVKAQFDLPAPVGETEKIYYEEADLVHEYLKQLTFVRNTSQSKRIAAKIDGLSEKMMELATRRSKLPGNRFEQVPREYVSKDNGFSVAQRALVLRIRRDAKPDEQLKDAVANFNSARDLLVAASAGESESVLKTRFAEFRKIRSETNTHILGDLFYEETKVANREMVIKPAREPQPDPVRDPPKVEPKPQPAPEAVASNSSLPSSSNPTPVESRSELNQPQTDTVDPSSPSSPFSPSMRDHFLRGMQAGMRPNVGTPVDGQAMVFPSQGFGAPGPGSPPGGGPPSFDKAESVKIIVSKTSQDGNELVKRLAIGLQSNAYSMSGSNGKITMQLKYTGELDAVVKLIDFGKVTLIDSPERTIHVSGD